MLKGEKIRKKVGVGLFLQSILIILIVKFFNYPKS